MSDANVHTNQLKRERFLRYIQDRYPEINPQSARLMDEMRMVSHLLHQMSESSLAESGLSYAQYRILFMLHFAEETDSCGMTPSEISDRQGTSRNTISSLIRTLEDDGLIMRHLDADDRRKFNILLTEAGRDVVMEQAKQHMLMVDTIFEILDPVEMKTLSDLLHKVNDHAIALREAKQPVTIGGSHASN